MINQHWSFKFVDPEEMQREQEAFVKDAINKKKCVVCENAALIDDRIAICNASGCDNRGKCVDEYTGENCNYWIPLDNL